MKNNQKGMSLLGLLIALLLVMILTSFLLKSYQKSAPGKQSAPKQTVEDVRKAVKNFEDVAAQRADFNPGKR